MALSCPLVFLYQLLASFARDIPRVARWPALKPLGWAGETQRQGAGQPEEEAMMQQGQEMVSQVGSDRFFSASFHTEAKAE